MIALIQSRLLALRGDPHMREVARGALSSLGARVLGVLLAFVFNVMLARLLGAEGAGLFFLALSVVLAAEVIGRFGLEYSLVRFVSAVHAQQDWGGVAGVWNHALRIGATVSIVMALLVAVLAIPLAGHVFGKPELSPVLLALSFAIVPLALTKLYAAALRGMKRILIYQLLQNALPLALVIALLIPFDLQFGKLHGAALAYVAGWALALGGGWWCWNAVLETIPRAAPDFPRARLLESCMPMLAVTLFGLLLTQLPVFFIGIWSDAKEVAVFSVALRVALLGAFLLHSMISILSPKFSELIASGKLGELETVARHSISFVVLSVVPLWITVLIFPSQILALFGDEFRQGGEVLVLMFTGQMLFGIFGIGGEILMMGGYERLARRSLFLAVLVCILTCAVFVPEHGGVGAALAVSLAYATHAAVSQFYVRRHFGFWLMPFSSRRRK
jgi:O-antigen/teichoic acid export membrane protein